MVYLSGVILKCPKGEYPRRVCAARYFSNEFTRKFTPISPIERIPFGTRLVQTSLLPSKIAQPKQHLNTFICWVSSIHPHVSGRLSNASNNYSCRSIHLSSFHNWTKP